MGRGRDPKCPAVLARLQYDAGEFVGRGRDPECYVAFIPYATSRPADFGERRALPKLV